jgi:hypothetical protein
VLPRPLAPSGHARPKRASRSLLDYQAGLDPETVQYQQIVSGRDVEIANALSHLADGERQNIKA